MPFIGPGRADCTSVCSTIMKLLIVFDTVSSRDFTQPRVNLLCVVKYIYIYIYILSLRCTTIRPDWTYYVIVPDDQMVRLCSCGCLPCLIHPVSARPQLCSHTSFPFVVKICTSFVAVSAAIMTDALSVDIYLHLTDKMMWSWSWT